MANRIVISAGAVLALSWSAGATAQELSAGQAKSADCVACHGVRGVSPNPMFPHLAGQNAAYLELQLEHFRSGKRYHPLMTPIAESLSPADMRDLAQYFSSIGPLADSRPSL